ncbi:MAG: hypothetical protein K2G03_06035, partial [Bacilli bacterium]|nr:hypothetical protein [Bacilli bacterium]
MSAELKEKYRSIFLSIAISDAYLSDSRVKSICRRLENFNFENYNESNYSKTIPYILFGKSNTLNDYVAISLSEFIDECPSSDKTIMFGMLNIGVENLKLTTILNGDEEEYIRLLAGNYNTTEESISYLLSILSSYDKADNDQTKEEYQREFYEKLGTILLDFYRNKDKENYQELDYEVLSSQIFDGDFTIHNNIFSDKIIVNFDDPNYGKYELYYDAKTRYPI